MRLRPIEVECYAGGRADERPRRVVIGDREHLIARLLSATVEETAAARKRMLRFRVMTKDGAVLVVMRDEGGKWYLESETHPRR